MIVEYRIGLDFFLHTHTLKEIDRETFFFIVQKCFFFCKKNHLFFKEIFQVKGDKIVGGTSGIIFLRGKP